MNLESQLDDLLDRWESARESGDTLSAEELCAGTPELLPQLRERIAVLVKMDRRLRDHHSTELHPSSQKTIKPLQDREHIPNERASVQTDFGGLKFHAQGGLGLVFSGTDLRLHRQVALKFMHQHLAQNSYARERFLLEAEITGRLDHPGIVPVHGVGLSEGGRPFYAMRFIRGETLDAAILRFHNLQRPGEKSRHTGLEFRSLLGRFISICNTLAYAHNCGIVHRDIKPENILLGKYAETLVVDWGLAMSVDRDETARQSGEQTLLPSSGSQLGASSGGPAGTPAYMAPEQARDCDHVDRRADIYSLGVLLYKMLCGKVPFTGANAIAVLEKVQRGDYPPARSVAADVPPGLEAICHKAMSFDPAARYETALQMAEDLEHWLADEPVSVYREAWSVRVMRWLRKHRFAAITLGAALAGLAILASVSAISLGTLAQSESELRAKADTARRAGLKTSALLAAETVGREIDRRWELLEREASKPKIIELLRKKPNPNQPADKETVAELQGWLRSLASEFTDKQLKFETLFLVSATGTQLARQPLGNGKTIGKNFEHRDYFHGKGRDFAEMRASTAALRPIETPHHSAAYLGSDGKLKIALSVPVWSDNPGTPDRQVLAVLGVSLELNEFGGLLASKLPGQSVVLADMRYDYLDGAPRRGLVLDHSAGDKPDRQPGDLPRLAADMIGQLLRAGSAKVWQEQQKARGAEIPNDTGGSATTSPGKGPQTVNQLFENYRDPIFDTRAGQRLAAFSEVLISGRGQDAEEQNKGALDTGWIVIVQEQAAGENANEEK
ncbi:MAG: serine/threonine protein kinase [Pirellulales bacterium]|nr:serine/threonine protein kinase [Pirellulales bacterium]